MTETLPVAEQPHPNQAALQALLVIKTLLQVGTFPPEKDVEVALRLSLEFINSLQKQLGEV